MKLLTSRCSPTGLLGLTLLLVAVFALLTGCSTVPQEADRLHQSGQYEQAYQLLSDAARLKPDDSRLRAALLRQRELSINRLATQAQLALSSNRLDQAGALIAKLEAMDGQHPRVAALRTEFERQQRHQQWLSQAREAEQQGRLDGARDLLGKVLAEAPGHPEARSAMLRLRERTAPPAPLTTLGAEYRKPVTLEFRDAPLRSVIEGLGRTTGVNFVFDKDVRPEAKVSVYLKDVSVDEALRVILATQQLQRKLLNERTVLIYPGTQAKAREHEELVTRNFYLVNADVKQAQTLVRSIAKTRDIFVDERLNLLVVRDTPAVVQLVERLIAGLDLPDPEVVLEVEVMELASNRLDELGIQWPEQVKYGLPGVTGDVLWSQREGFRATIANPGLVATLRETYGSSNTLANPRLRARNREKAKVLIGEKLPVFTTTSTPNNGSLSLAATVTYLEVGLKLEVEPSVQLDNDVIMKVNLDVSTLIGRVDGPGASVAYQVGTRQASTSLRLRDGETQILAGLIRDDDSKAISGLPGLARLPLVGRLFGVHSDGRVKNEVVLLITPHVVRNIGLPEASVISVPAGVDGDPGASSIRLRSGQMGLPLGRGNGPAPATDPGDDTPPEAAAAAPEEAAPKAAVLVLSTTQQVEVGGAVAVTLQNRSGASLRGELGYDPMLLQPAQSGKDNNGRLSFAVGPGGQRVYMMRALPKSAGQRFDVRVDSVQGAGPEGAALNVQVEGQGMVEVLAR